MIVILSVIQRTSKWVKGLSLDDTVDLGLSRSMLG